MKGKPYKVLWIDDDPSEELMDEALRRYGIDIDCQDCYSDGLKTLSENLCMYDAVILDVYCKYDRYESSNFESFQDNVRKVDELCTKGECFIPWFVYTGGPSGHEDGYRSIKVLVESFGRGWDTRDYYNKPSDSGVMLEKVIQEADKRAETRLRHKYPQIFSIDTSINLELMGVLSSYESGKLCERDYDVLRNIGVIMERLRHYLTQTGYLPPELVSGIKISQCASFLGKKEMQCLIPQYIQQNIYTCVLTGSEGGHALPAREDIEKGNAPYLNHAIISSLLSVLYWLSQQDMNEDVISQRKTYSQSLLPSVQYEAVSAEEYEDQIFVVEIDENGTPHCKDCILPPGGERYKGQKVKLCTVTQNNSRESKRRYPLFAKYKPIDQGCDSPS